MQSYIGSAWINRTNFLISNMATCVHGVFSITKSCYIVESALVNTYAHRGTEFPLGENNVC